MSLLLDAAIAWRELENKSYVFDVGRKGKLARINLSFSDIDLPHLVGMQYAQDIDFGLNRNEIYGSRFLPAVLSNKLDVNKIEDSINWGKISGRLRAIINLEDILDKEFVIAQFSPAKVTTYSRIEACFVIKGKGTDDTYFFFLDEDTDRYYCKSAFSHDYIDYMENQSIVTVLQKTKITGGTAKVLYTKKGYSCSTQT